MLTTMKVKLETRRLIKILATKNDKSMVDFLDELAKKYSKEKGVK